ncbi:MAG TPA: SHOCT domain-containing protein [Actinomycetaceae bacterium]|nr:SHOCT domain-containing protein [Actinomycetaceae bacterium]
MSLIRSAARASVITSAATRAHHRTAQRQRGRWAAENAAAAASTPAPAAPPPPKDTATMLEQLRQLGELRDAGVLSEAEFEVQKARVLHGI